ncbi:uncharacterized protein MONOS_673 [Monocercomonoides exilis]|uniref:uncharacterized protein n=1 Tax=Monocercomonoides exilis TaxID=2049356 RepID=UPI00355A1525|nr:hypothetical protein MONOS_673 [Monocercomonoides exilis]|eukprot:MONOS_673.1-p1 / transcript=MONOS_673.1 / gene=MONOS_673 / organism=Monocercomonoides_exilis_PA203 / gene_product=unspecified product / transcript_product=unspecified product / location=Mono_scaffold00011:117089-119097(-) / protein_length=652 / sequence_SO=supercontig / SO=protein_coding / is_pseudo=false
MSVVPPIPIESLEKAKLLLYSAEPSPPNARRPMDSMAFLPSFSDVSKLSEVRKEKKVSQASAPHAISHRQPSFRKKVFSMKTKPLKNKIEDEPQKEIELDFSDDVNAEILETSRKVEDLSSNHFRPDSKSMKIKNLVHEDDFQDQVNEDELRELLFEVKSLMVQGKDRNKRLAYGSQTHPFQYNRASGTQSAFLMSRPSSPNSLDYQPMTRRSTVTVGRETSRSRNEDSDDHIKKTFNLQKSIQKLQKQMKSEEERKKKNKRKKDKKYRSSTSLGFTPSSFLSSAQMMTETDRDLLQTRKGRDASVGEEGIGIRCATERAVYRSGEHSEGERGAMFSGPSFDPPQSGILSLIGEDDEWMEELPEGTSTEVMERMTRRQLTERRRGITPIRKIEAAALTMKFEAEMTRAATERKRGHRKTEAKRMGSTLASSGAGGATLYGRGRPSVLPEFASPLSSPGIRQPSSHRQLVSQQIPSLSITSLSDPSSLTLPPSSSSSSLSATTTATATTSSSSSSSFSSTLSNRVKSHLRDMQPLQIESSTSSSSSQSLPSHSTQSSTTATSASASATTTPLKTQKMTFHSRNTSLSPPVHTTLNISSASSASSSSNDESASANKTTTAHSTSLHSSSHLRLVEDASSSLPYSLPPLVGDAH